MSPKQENQLDVKNVPPADQIGGGKTIYDVSGLKVFNRNVIAGMGRAVGGTIVYIASLLVVAYLFNLYVLPRFMPLVDTLQDSIDTLELIQEPDQENLKPIINQMVR